jgi:CubicO group peptidase (beta-lactamase class C family)
MIPPQACALLDEFIEDQMRAAGAPAVVAALTDRDQLLHLTAHGLADVAAGVPARPETLFEIGSISKSFTAIALLQLHEAGRLDLHAPVTRYLPWFQVNSRYEPITVHHLLTHTAGIIMGTDFSTEGYYEVWALRETEATAPPGTYFHYSNVGYKALGLVLEALLDRPYGQILQERVLDPLGMRETEAVITHDTRRRLAVGYEPWYDDRPFQAGHRLVPATWLESATADGSIATTAADMATYLRCWLNRGRGLLSEEGFGLLTQRAIVPSDEEHGTYYGYGLNIGESDGRAVIHHTGGMVGYESAVLADLDDGFGVAALSNGPGEPADIARFALQLLRAVRHGQQLPPLPGPKPVEGAAGYAGTYRAGAQVFSVAEAEGRLVMGVDGDRIPLAARPSGAFLVPHPDFDRFALRFGRHQGQVVEAFHGPDWYVNERYRGPTTFDHPQEWEAYVGHYRSHNPWLSNFRVVLRKGALVLIQPEGGEESLIPLSAGVFRVGDEKRSPERLRFDTVLDGRALRADLSGCPCYRTFTP